MLLAGCANDSLRTVECLHWGKSGSFAVAVVRSVDGTIAAGAIETGRFHLRRRQPRDIAHLLWGTGSDTASSFTRQRCRTTIILVGPDSLCAQMAATNGLGGAE